MTFLNLLPLFPMLTCLEANILIARVKLADTLTPVQASEIIHEISQVAPTSCEFLAGDVVRNDWILSG